MIVWLGSSSSRRVRTYWNRQYQQQRAWILTLISPPSRRRRRTLGRTNCNAERNQGDDRLLTSRQSIRGGKLFPGMLAGPLDWGPSPSEHPASAPSSLGTDACLGPSRFSQAPGKHPAVAPSSHLPNPFPLSLTIIFICALMFL